MTLWATLLERGRARTVHATLIDPARTAPSTIGKHAEAVAAVGTDLILVGGSTDVTGQLVQGAVDAIHDVCDLPVVLFPSSHEQVAAGLDGILFTVPFNSTRPDLIVGEQARGAEPVVNAGIEAITTAYVVVEPGMTVGRVAAASLVPRTDEGARRVRAYAHLARVLRFDALYLEAGSGAPEPVPRHLIEAAAPAGVPIIAGGGIRKPEQAIAAARAGATMVVTGTVAENAGADAVRRIVEALKS